MSIALALLIDSHTPVASTAYMSHATREVNDQTTPGTGRQKAQTARKSRLASHT
jgi:hypothetical protein